MTKRADLANTLMLAPLLGVSDALPKALTFLGLSLVVITLYGLSMQKLRPRLSAPLRLIASLMLAATWVSGAQLLLQAHALAMYQQLGIYLALISVQCVVMEYSGFFDTGQSKTRIRLFGLFAVLTILLGLLRTSAITTSVPAGFILLGLLLAGFQAWNQCSTSR